jgi:hypothetical protein
MRLLSTHDLTFKEFFVHDRPEYTILSHTWGAEEATFKEMNKMKTGIKHRAGYEKILNCARVSKERGFQWTWIDTCCIDKRSSAELSEAINSKFAWYKKSAECLVYLADFESEDGTEIKDWSNKTLSQFRGSSWFKRGWTLQEMIAPIHLRFYNKHWKPFGDFGDENFVSLLSDITKMPLDKLLCLDELLRCEKSSNNNEERLLLMRRMRSLHQSQRLKGYSIAQKMSWAASRTTTRQEDIAYCLFGIFNVNMPLLYGEGTKAFLRLQEEIIKRSGDRSIFAWEPKDNGYNCNLLATSPQEFMNCHSTKLSSQDTRHVKPPFSLTHRGFQFQEEVVPFTDTLKGIYQNSQRKKLGRHLAKEVLYLLCLWGVERTEGMTLAVILDKVDLGGMSFTRVWRRSLIQLPTAKLREVTGASEVFYVL